MWKARNPKQTMAHAEVIASRYSISKQIYLSLFVLFFRINKGAWPEYVNADAHKGAAGITLLDLFLALAASNFVQTLTGHQVLFARDTAGIVALSVYFVNWYFFVGRGTGTAFEKEFNGFARKRQIALYLLATAITLATVALLSISVMMYRSAFAGNGAL